MRTFLEVDAASGCRRGELPALVRHCGGCAIISRSLTQTFRNVPGAEGKSIRVHDVLTFKSTKTEKPRVAVLPESALAALETHRQRQDELRQLYGPDYRADLDLIFAIPMAHH